MSNGMRIAVVGGGPAGATCARLMAAAGARVDLFEARPEREKPCGGGIPGRALAEFPELAVGTLSRRVVREVVLFSPSNRRAAIPLRDAIHIFRRCELDAHLRRQAQAAGAALHMTKVTAIRKIPDGRWELATGEGSIGPFDQLVGADGVGGIVRRAAAGGPDRGDRPGRFEDDELTLALYGYVPGAGQGEMILKFFRGFNGYLWAFPRTDHVSVGICANHRQVAPAMLADELRRFVEAHYPVARLAPGALKGHFIPASPRPLGRSNGGPRDNWALIGDAGGFVDPITREGIAHAMRSAAVLASDLAARGHLRTPRLDAGLTWAHRHASWFYREEFLEHLTRLASASAAIRNVLADLLTGHQSYGRLKTRLLMNMLPCGLQVGMRGLAAAAGVARDWRGQASR